MRLGNPALRSWVRKSSSGVLGVEDKAATYGGIYLKSAIFAILTIIAAVATEVGVLYAIGSEHYEFLVYIGIAALASSVVLLVLALIIAFVPTTAKVLGVIYSLLQGAVLGLYASLIDIFVPGIAFAAFLATAAVFIVSLIVNKLTRVRISSGFMRGLMVAFFSLLIIQLVMFLLSLFGVFNYAAYFWVQFIVCALSIVWATVMLFWDLQNIDYMVQTGADKKYEWNVAFSLVTTLIYMYIEILELLLRLAALFSKNKK